MLLAHSICHTHSHELNARAKTHTEEPVSQLIHRMGHTLIVEGRIDDDQVLDDIPRAFGICLRYTFARSLFMQKNVIAQATPPPLIMKLLEVIVIA